MTRAAASTATPDAESLRAAVAGVDDPEMPGVSIVDLGLLESIVSTPDGAVTVELIPTFSGCPALAVIADAVAAAVGQVDGVTGVEVRFLRSPAWSVDRVSPRAQQELRERLGISVERDGTAMCPRCGSVTEQRSMFGATRCRAIHVCPACREVVEVMR